MRKKILTAQPAAWALGVLALSGAVLAQAPTFSVEVTEINGVPLQSGPAQEVVVSPGDVLTTKILLRDWSPDGEKLRAYQTGLDPFSFESGDAGKVQPVGYEAASRESTPNTDNALIDTKEPLYVFGQGTNTLPMTDAVSPGYRWLAMVVDPADSVPSPQDGTKFYCGTVRLEVSKDARGTFTLTLNEAVGASTLRDPDVQPIIPLEFERLKVVVRAGAPALRILSSDPPAGSIDARHTAGHSGSWDRVHLTFNADTVSLRPEDFTINDGSGSPPGVKRLLPAGSTVVLVLDRGIRRGAWTTVTHRESKTGTRLGSLPGDVNSDGEVNAGDLRALLSPSEDADGLPLYRRDVNDDGSSSLKDLVRLIDLLTEPGAYRAKLEP